MALGHPRDWTLPGTSVQIAVFVALWGVGAAFDGIAGGLILSAALWMWHLIELLLSWFGWMATPPPVTVPVQLPSYPLVDLYCAWAVFLFGCSGILNLVLLCANNPARITLAVPAPWIRGLHTRLTRCRAGLHRATNQAPWATWLLALALLPGVLIAKTVFT